MWLEVLDGSSFTYQVNEISNVFVEVSAAIDIDKLPTSMCRNACGNVWRCEALGKASRLNFMCIGFRGGCGWLFSYEFINTRSFSELGRVLRITREAIIVSKSSSSFRQPFWRRYPCHSGPNFVFLIQGVPSYSANSLIQLKLRLLSRVIACHQRSHEFSYSCQSEMLSRYHLFGWAEVLRENNFRRYSGKLKSFVW